MRRFTKRPSHLKPRVIYSVSGQFDKNRSDGLGIEEFWSLGEAKKFLKLMQTSPEHRKQYYAFEIDDRYVVELKGVLYYFGFDSEAEQPVSKIARSAQEVFEKKHARFNYEAHVKEVKEMVGLK